jgi:hypothetical protein
MSKLCVALNHPDAHQHGPTHALPITRCCKPQIRKSTHSHAMRNSNRIGHNHAQVRVEYQSCTTRAGQVRIVRPGIVIFGRQCIAASQSRSVTERTQADGVYLAAQCNCEAKDYQNVRFKVFRQGVYGTKDAYGTQDVYGTPNCGAPDCNSAGRGQQSTAAGAAAAAVIPVAEAIRAGAGMSQLTSPVRISARRARCRISPVRVRPTSPDRHRRCVR